MDGTPSGVKEEEEGKNLLCVLPVEQVVVVVVGPSEIETRAMTPFQKKISNNSVRVDGWSKFLGGGDGTKRKCTLHATPGTWLFGAASAPTGVALYQQIGAELLLLPR